jgi:hypothetical protein
MIQEQPKQPLEDLELGPEGPRTPYPVDQPIDPTGPGSEPDYFPGKPGGAPPKLRHASRRARLLVGWQQSH